MLFSYKESQWLQVSANQVSTTGRLIRQHQNVKLIFGQNLQKIFASFEHHYKVLHTEISLATKFRLKQIM